MNIKKLKKYKYKLRILLILTPSYKDKRYLHAKKKYEKYLKKFHKYHVKAKSILHKKFGIILVGFDGKIKKTYKKISVSRIISDIRKMPLGKIRKKLKPINLSLYADYNKKKSKKGFGYSSKEKAETTIKKLKKEKLRYQLYVITTMLGRAKGHPYQTQGMRDAIKVFKKWLKKYNNSKN